MMFNTVRASEMSERVQSLRAATAKQDEEFKAHKRESIRQLQKLTELVKVLRYSL